MNEEDTFLKLKQISWSELCDRVVTNYGVYSLNEVLMAEDLYNCGWTEKLIQDKCMSNNSITQLSAQTILDLLNSKYQPRWTIKWMKKIHS